MKLKMLPLAIVMAASVSVISCKNTGYKPLHGGLEYKVMKAGTGDVVKAGEIGMMKIVMKIGDSTISNTDATNNEQPIEVPLGVHVQQGDLSEGFMHMKAGERAIFRIPLDTIEAKTGQQLPPEFKKKGKYAYWDVTLVKLMPGNTDSKPAMDDESQQMGADDKKIRAYFKQHNINVANGTPAADGKAYPLENGVYGILLKKGTGPKVQNGQTATMNYTGMLLDGTKFDSNEDPAFRHQEPFGFIVGSGRVIRGWEVAVAAMHVGDKMKVFIPSPLAYGKSGAGDKVPADAVLVFDMEVLSSK